MGKDGDETLDPHKELRLMLIEYRKALAFDKEEKTNTIGKLVKNIESNTKDPLSHFFYATFQARRETEDVEGFSNRNLVWNKAIEFLDSGQDQSEKEVGIRKELSVVALYRMYRNLNEWYEHVKVRDEDLTKLWEHGTINSELVETLIKEKLSKKSRSSYWREIAFHDDGPSGESKSGGTSQRIFRKSFSEYYELMKNEINAYDRRLNAKSPPFVWYGDSLDRFLSNEVTYLCNDLLHRLESLFNHETGGYYEEDWEKFRTTGKAPRDEFIEYQNQTNMLVDFLKNIVKLHEDPKSKELKRSDKFRTPLFEDKQLSEEGKRFEIFLEVAWIHAVIACQKNDIDELNKIFEKWPSDYGDDESRKNRSILRTSRKKSMFQQLRDKTLDLDQFLLGKSDGMSYALLLHWLRGKSDGFYLALASNLCPGHIVGKAKLKRATNSSLWGNKIILKDGATYHQIAQSIPDEHWEDIGIKLSEANKYFFSIPANKWVGDVESERLMFGVTRFTFKDAGEVLLQSEWQDALPVDGNINGAKLNKLIEHIWNFATRDRDGGSNHEAIKTLSLQHLDSKWLELMKQWFNIGKDDVFQARIFDWIHGDEWGGNFTVNDQLYAIDLEDVLHREDGNGKNIIVGGLHAWRFINRDMDKSTIGYNFNGQLPIEAFNAYSAIGRLFAALIQKILASDYRQRYPDEHWEKYIENSMRQIWNILKSKEQQNTRIKRRKVLFQIWVSFADWLAYWKNKSEEKLEPIDFETMINYIKTLATGESTTQESSPE
ncbi:MAG: hypothetical protein ACPICB_00480 [Candidatus Poseidoniaceae archaeon]